MQTKSQKKRTPKHNIYEWNGIRKLINEFSEAGRQINTKWRSRSPETPVIMTTFQVYWFQFETIYNFFRWCSKDTDWSSPVHPVRPLYEIKLISQLMNEQNTMLAGYLSYLAVMSCASAMYLWVCFNWQQMVCQFSSTYVIKLHSLRSLRKG